LMGQRKARGTRNPVGEPYRIGRRIGHERHERHDDGRGASRSVGSAAGGDGSAVGSAGRADRRRRAGRDAVTSDRKKLEMV
jgi:hypothetical protein